MKYLFVVDEELSLLDDLVSSLSSCCGVRDGDVVCVAFPSFLDLNNDIRTKFRGVCDNIETFPFRRPRGDWSSEELFHIVLCALGSLQVASEVVCVMPGLVPDKVGWFDELRAKILLADSDILINKAESGNACSFYAKRKVFAQPFFLRFIPEVPMMKSLKKFIMINGAKENFPLTLPTKKQVKLGEKPSPPKDVEEAEIKEQETSPFGTSLSPRPKKAAKKATKKRAKSKRGKKKTAKKKVAKKKIVPIIDETPPVTPAPETKAPIFTDSSFDHKVDDNPSSFGVQ